VVLTGYKRIGINFKKTRDQMELIECSNHGPKREAFVCRHLDYLSRKGFNEAFETYKGMELVEGDDLQAWCDDCEKIRVKYNGWTEESEKYAEIKLICEDCYFELKKINK
jgi:hypothetical protein